MKKPKNWIIVAMLTAIIGFAVNKLGDKIFPSSATTINIQLVDGITAQPKRTGKVIIIIDGKEFEESANKDGNVKFKIPEEYKEKSGKLKVVDKQGNEQYSEDILINDETNEKNIEVDVFDVEEFIPKNHKNKAYDALVNNFKFDFQELKREGERITMFYKVTNMEEEDRKLTFIPFLNVFFDDQGNQIKQNSMACIAKRCNSSGFKRDLSAWDEKRNPVSNSMPAGIPLNVKFVVRGVSKKATKFTRIDFDVRINDNKQEMQLTNVELPTTTGGPNVAIYGDFIVKWEGVQKQSETTFAQFKVFNLSAQTYTFEIGHATAYDNQGNQYTLKKTAFGKPANPQKNSEKLLPKSSERFYMPIHKIDASATSIQRITLKIGKSDYDFDEAKKI